ncbi:hypothetical protein [Neobacillus jeddahensis]|uniref:hypothetical protein n=1 Tax=Neobacillus jeddahensis TaxID=1461580 RepID=UPI00058C68CB|nr:hypothetical protein [Neobacillus jeddahensis]
MDILPQEQTIVYQFLSIALGGNTYLHPYIDESYQKNEWEYYEAYQKSNLNGNPLFSMYSTKSEEKIRQVAGLLAWCDQHQQFFPLDQLIKKGYKFAYHYFQHHSYIDFDHFMRSFGKKQKNKVVKELDLLYQNIILWYLCVRENKPFNTSNVAWQSFQKVLLTTMNELEWQKSMFSPEMLAAHKKEIDELYQAYNIPQNAHFDSLGFFLEYLISDKLTGIVEKYPSYDSEKAEQLVFQNSPTKFIGALGGWLKTLHIQELDATEQISLTKGDLDTVFLELLYAKKYNNVSHAEQDLFFIACLYIKCLSSLYRETKHLFLDQSKQDYYLEMKAKEEKLHEQEADLFRQSQEWQLTNKQHQQQIDGLTEELRAAEAKIRQLEQKIGNLEDYTEEVHALRSFVYSEEQGDQTGEQTPSLKSMTTFIQSKRIVIFGGAPHWRNKVKELLPSVEFIDVDEMNRDISKIQRVDAVFINTNVFAHAFYKKIMKELSQTATPMYYLSGHSNLEKTTFEIYKWLTE